MVYLGHDDGIACAERDLTKVEGRHVLEALNEIAKASREARDVPYRPGGRWYGHGHVEPKHLFLSVFRREAEASGSLAWT